MFILIIEAGACLIMIKDELDREKNNQKKTELSIEEKEYIDNDKLALKGAIDKLKRETELWK
jgi:hypothetical protein